jgi:exonuclease SbcD
VTPVPLPVPRPLTVLTGALEQLLADPALAAVEEHFLSVRLTDPARPVDPMRRLQQRFPHCVHLEWSAPRSDDAGTSYRERLRGRSDVEVAAEFVRSVRGVPASRAELDLLGAALAEAGRAEVAG